MNTPSALPTMNRIILIALTVFMFAAPNFAHAMVAPAFRSSSVPDSASPTTTVESGAPAPVIKAAEFRIPVGKTGKFISLQELSSITTADFEKLSGKKMGWLRRVEFRLAQKKVRRSINSDGTVNNATLAKMAGGFYDDDKSFHFGGFALGFFLGLIGVLIAYIINDDNHPRRVRWAWYGFGIFVSILLIVTIAAAAGSSRPN